MIILNFGHKGVQTVLKFLENLRQSENKKAKVLLKHSLWGEQRFETEDLHIINDERIGVVVKGQELFIYKDNVKEFETSLGRLWVTDGRMSIKIILNNL